MTHTRRGFFATCAASLIVSWDLMHGKPDGWVITNDKRLSQVIRVWIENNWEAMMEITPRYRVEMSDGKTILLPGIG